MTHETSRYTNPDRPVELAQPELHVIFGAGQIGARLAEELLTRGHRVRMIRRGQPGRPVPGLEWRRGDGGVDPLARRCAGGVTAPLRGLRRGRVADARRCAPSRLAPR
jgi:uncharacterized protein YbjT (DUF2867 family)